ncbi:MAG TPA: hypothetical protein PK295_00745 [Candidatus Magasanikbacteria bacterium]|nr:hypothetical protein [Candidatus Magasanikbacteria bacterium]
MSHEKTPKDIEDVEELEREWNNDVSNHEEGDTIKAPVHEHGEFVKHDLETGEKAEKKDKKKEKHAKKKKHAHEKHSKGVAYISHEDVIEDEEKIVSEEETGRGKVIADQLSQIYENSDGSMPDMKTFESRKTSRFVRALVIFLISCIFFGAAAWVGLFVLQPKSQFSETDVSLGISGEDSVLPGSEVTYRIRYRNAQSMTLHEVVLETRFPGGFKITTTTKAGDDETHTRWTLGDLDPGSGGYIDITGIFFGDSGSEQSIRSFLSYKPDNFTSTFQAVATKTIQAKSDAATIEIGIADSVPRGGKTPITITITPAADVVLEHVRLSCASIDFTPDIKSTPASIEGSPCSWNFDTIREKTVIELAGMFASPTSSSDFEVELRGWENEDRVGEGYVLGTTKKNVTLTESTTNVSLVINGGSGDTTISPGETIAASIVVQNKGETPLTDVVIEALIDGPSYSNRSILGWQDLVLTGDADVGGEQLTPDTRRGKVTWNKQYVPGLASIAPGEQVRVDVSIPIRSGEQITLGNFTTNNIVFASSFSYGKTAERKTISSNQINLTLVSDFALKSDYDFTSSAGMAGTYDISWSLTNSFHGLKNIKLEMDLYGDVEVDPGKFTVAAGEMKYDGVNKRITWTIPEMPTSVDILSAQFPVILKVDNPTQKDLTSKVRMSADDQTTNVTIKKVGDGVTLR